MGPWTCSTEDGHPAVMAITNLETGDVVSPCGECAVGYLIAMAAAMLPEPGQFVWQAAEVAATPTTEGGPAPTPASRKRGRNGRQGPQATPLQGQAPDAGPANDDS